MHDGLSLMIEALTALHTHSPKVASADRIELKRMSCGHFRLYVPVPPTFTKADASQFTALLANLPVSFNPFSAGGRITALTITDDREGMSETPDA